jgi:hypothetical protein
LVAGPARHETASEPSSNLRKDKAYFSLNERDRLSSNGFIR